MRNIKPATLAAILFASALILPMLSGCGGGGGGGSSSGTSGTYYTISGTIADSIVSGSASYTVTLSGSATSGGTVSQIASTTTTTNSYSLSAPTADISSTGSYSIKVEDASWNVGIYTITAANIIAGAATANVTVNETATGAPSPPTGL
jgi:hypothetical protein